MNSKTSWIGHRFPNRRSPHCWPSLQFSNKSEPLQWAGTSNRRPPGRRIRLRRRSPQQVAQAKSFSQSTRGLISYLGSDRRPTGGRVLRIKHRRSRARHRNETGGPQPARPASGNAARPPCRRPRTPKQRTRRSSAQTLPAQSPRSRPTHRRPPCARPCQRRPSRKLLPPLRLRILPHRRAHPSSPRQGHPQLTAHPLTSTGLIAQDVSLCSS